MFGGQPSYDWQRSFLFTCMPTGRTSESMTARPKDLSLYDMVGT